MVDLVKYRDCWSIVKVFNFAILRIFGPKDFVVSEKNSTFAVVNKN